MSYSSVISSDILYQHLDDHDWRIIDCRFNLQAPDQGRGQYAIEHIPNALYAHLDEDLSSPVTETSGRHPLPDIEKLKAKLGEWGINAQTQVLAYDDAGGSYAARLWWLLHWLGHTKVAVLDGGFSIWKKQGLPTTAERPCVSPTVFTGEPNNEMLISTDELQRQLKHYTVCLIDVRDPERFTGKQEPIDKVAGHIPGANNIPWKHNIDGNSLFLPKGQLYDQYKALLQTRPANEITFMCGSGVTACHSLVVLAYLGISGAKLYAGSWSEWIRDPARPIMKDNH
ncbi:MAG: sulfurtransferase [Gammaproteobacteria bacterium]|jgi:thiosulfate/3-mercaptopyruvate sulfurtransferase